MITNLPFIKLKKIHKIFANTLFASIGKVERLISMNEERAAG